MYKIIDLGMSVLDGKHILGIQKIDAVSMYGIPFDPANTDYQKFKVDVADGVPLEDPDGNVMTQEQVDEFLRTIP